MRAHLFPGHQIRLRGSVHTVTSWDVEEHKIIIKAGYWTHTATIAAQSITEVAGVVVSQTTPGTCATTAGGADRTAATNCGAAGTCATTAGGADRTAATDCGAANNAACNQQANCEASVTVPATWSAVNNAACNQQANCEASVTAPATWTAGSTVTGTLASGLQNEWTMTVAPAGVTELAGAAVTQGGGATVVGTLATNLQSEWTLTIAGTCATTAGGADRTAATDCGAANNAACNQQANCEASVTAPATWSATNNAACNQQANCEASVTAPATWTAGITVTGTLAADLTGAGMVTVSIISPIDYVFDNSNILTIGTNPLNAVAQANIVSVTHVETKSVPTSGEFQLCYANNCTNCIPWGSKGYVVSEQLVEFVPEITGVTTTLSVSTDATELEYRILFNGA